MEVFILKELCTQGKGAFDDEAVPPGLVTVLRLAAVWLGVLGGAGGVSRGAPGSICARELCLRAGDVA
jgi:hypothetical protein